MPNGSLNLYISIQSGSSERTLVSLADKTRALDKETQELKQTTEGFAKASKSLMEEQTRLQSEMKASQKVVNELQRAYDEYGDELSRNRLDAAIEQHAKLKTELAEVNTQLNANRKSYKETVEAIRKGGLQESGGQGGALSEKSDFAKTQLYSEILKPLIGAGGEFAEAFLTSALGTPTASLISDAFSGVLSGAAAGSILGPWGAFGGAVLGGLTGLVTGGTKIFEAQDDAFKDYYGGLYDDVKGRSGEMVEAGSTIAGGREQTRIAFEQKLGGKKQAAEYLARVEEMASSTNYDYDEIVGYTKSLLNTYDSGRVLDVLQTLSDASGGLGLDSSDVSQLIQGLYMLRSSDTANSQYLKSFTTRGVDTNQAIADYLNEQTGWEKYGKNDVTQLIRDGKVSGEDAAQAILDYIDNNYGRLSILQSKTYDAMVDNLGDITASLQAAGGDAYNELRKESVEAEMNALGGELGEAIGEINRVMGENQARRENLEDQYMRETLEAVLLGKEGTLFDAAQQEALKGMAQEYAEAQKRYEKSERTDAEAGAQMERLKEQAEAMGKAYFENSDFVKMLNETEEEEVKAIREATAGLYEATQASYKLSQELSKGLGAIPRSISSADVDYRSLTWTDDGGNVHYAAGSEPDGWYDDGGNFHPHAFGLDRVPYDEYPALLHEGERVLTASEARAQDMAQAGAAPIQSIISGNTFVGVTEEMADQLWAIIVRNLEREARARAPK